MTAAYDGRQVVGMDLHRRRSVLVRMTEDGRKLETARIDNSPAALRGVLARARTNPRVVVEATYGWYWAADTLQAAGAEAHLAHPLGVKAFSYRPVLGAVTVAEIGDVSRFPGPGQLCSWAGLTPRHRESDVKVARGYITKQGSPVLRWAMVEAAGTSRPPARPASSRTPSSTAAAGRPGTSPRSRRPASCSPASCARCATGRSGPWPPSAARSPRPGEQARNRAARNRLQVWPPPPGGAAAALIDPAARRGPPHAPAAGNRGNPEGMTAARRLPLTRPHRGAGTQPHTALLPAGPLSDRGRPASRTPSGRRWRGRAPPGP
jgi:Transposase IS116/IS110/IS902 family